MTFPFLTQMRLDVEDPTLLAYGQVVSQIKNPNGRQGGWGWITPTVGRAYGILASTSPVKYLLVFETPGGASRFYSEPALVTPGNPYVAAWTTEASPPTYYYRASLIFLDASGATVATVATAITRGGFGTDPTLSTTVPSGATRVRLTFDLYETAAGANPTTVSRIYLRDVRMGPTNYLPNLVQTPAFRNLLTTATSVTVDREELNVGTLTATIPDATYDPSLNSLLRPGRLVRLISTEPIAPGEVVARRQSRNFTGRLSAATVKYDPSIVGNKSAQITLTAVDDISNLANVSRPEGVGAVQNLRGLLEGAGVPWRINGDTGQAPPPPIITRNESATLLDQVAITRDSWHGYAWMDVEGVFKINDPVNMSNLTIAELTETDYAEDIDISFDTERLINTATIKLLRVNAATGETVEVPYGPFVRQASVDQWGPRSSEFTIQGREDTSAAMAAFAEEIFDANATPEVVVNSLTLRVASYDDPGRFLDLYDKVRITNDNAGIDQSPRITKITHRITPKNWLVDLGFARDGGVAAPQVTPPLVSNGSTSPAAPKTQSGTANFGTFSGTAVQAVAVTFPAAFTATPRVLAIVRTSTPNAFTPVTVAGHSATGCTLYLARTSGTAAVNVDYYAFV